MALFDIANIIGVPFDQFKLLLCSLLALPLGFLNYYITNPSIRLLYGFITGICIQYYMFGNQIIHMISQIPFNGFDFLIIQNKYMKKHYKSIKILLLQMTL